MSEPRIDVETHRPAASRVWKYEHRWGQMIGDTRDLRVIRVNGGKLEINYGKNSVEIREELVPLLAKMVAEAAAWSESEDTVSE